MPSLGWEFAAAERSAIRGGEKTRNMSSIETTITETISPAPNGGSAPNGGADTLPSLRVELDAIDDAIFAELARRAAVVERVAALKGGALAFRPGREAMIMRRLLARAKGVLPRQTVARVWREILSGSLAQQGRFAIAVCEAGPSEALGLLARAHFGVATPLRSHRRAAQAIADLAGGAAQIAVLPLPAEDDSPAALWWTSLLHQETLAPPLARVHILARLPFWSRDGAQRPEALVAAAGAPDPSGEDRTLFGFEFSVELSRTRLAQQIAAAGFVANSLILRRDATAPVAQALVDLDGFIEENDPRLVAIGSLIRPPVRLGAYAVPLEERAP